MAIAVVDIDDVVVERRGVAALDGNDLTGLGGDDVGLGAGIDAEVEGIEVLIGSVDGIKVTGLRIIRQQRGDAAGA